MSRSDDDEAVLETRGGHAGGPLRLRPDVAAFAQVMEFNLMLHDHDRGSGMRLYVPKDRVNDLQLKSGDHYRFQVLEAGRLRLTPVQARIEPVKDQGVVGELPAQRIRLELTVREASALEANLVAGDRAQRDLLVELAKRIRRRMRLQGWPTVDRTNDQVENLP